MARGNFARLVLTSWILNVEFWFFWILNFEFCKACSNELNQTASSASPHYALSLPPPPAKKIQSRKMQIALRCEQKMFEIIELLSRVFPRSLHNEIVDRIKDGWKKSNCNSSKLFGGIWRPALAEGWLVELSQTQVCHKQIEPDYSWGGNTQMYKNTNTTTNTNTSLPQTNWTRL